MASDKKTPSERAGRPKTGQRPTPVRPTVKSAANLPRTNAPLSQPPGKGPVPKAKRSGGASWKAVGENVGWSLVIGLPIFLVVLAILWRATNGFEGTPSANQPLPTASFTPTAGAFVAAPEPSDANAKDNLLYVQSATGTSPMQLFSARQDGTAPYQLTNTNDNKGSPSWSPDGKQIAFTADGVGIQIVNFDGSGLHTVAYGGFSPSWSPDGKQIAFLKNVPAPDGQGPERSGSIRVLYVVSAMGKAGDERQLAADALGHNWSPDSKTIAFFSLYNAVMFTVEVETGKIAQVKLPNNTGAWYPTFAPDGNSFVFYGNPNPAAMVQALDLALASASLEEYNQTAPPTTAPSPSSGANDVIPYAPVTTTVEATRTPNPSPTIAPGALSQISLYQVNRDGTNLRKLQDLEPADGAGGGKHRFTYHIATSADLIAILTSRPYYKVGPVFAPDGKSVAALYVNKDSKVGMVVAHIDGAPSTIIVEGENNLEAGTRLNASFASDSSRVFYNYIPVRPTATVANPNPIAVKQIRSFGFADKTEKTVIASNDNSFIACCGFVRR